MMKKWRCIDIMVSSIKEIDNLEMMLETSCNDRKCKSKSFRLIVNDLTRELFCECVDCNDRHQIIKSNTDYVFWNQKKVVVKPVSDKMACSFCKQPMKEAVLENIKPLFNEIDVKKDELITIRKEKDDIIFEKIRSREHLEILKDRIILLEQEELWYKQKKNLKHNKSKNQTIMLDIPNRITRKRNIDINIKLIMEIPEFIAIQLEKCEYHHDEDLDKYYLYNYQPLQLELEKK